MKYDAQFEISQRRIFAVMRQRDRKGNGKIRHVLRAAIGLGICAAGVWAGTWYLAALMQPLPV